MWTDYHGKFHQTLKNRLLLPKSSKILIAVSGGQDSLCLGKLCLDLQLKWDWHLAIAHFNHGWILDEGLALHVEKIAKNWSLDFYLETAKQKITESEGEARKYRYEGLVEIATKYQFNYLITGHTLSDRGETFLYNLMRGAGMEGLSALNWTRKLNDNITLVRPLLNFTRGDTLAFCQQLQLPIWEDKYNKNKKFARNRIRLELIPYLKKEFNSQIEQHLSQTAEILRGDIAFLTEETEKLFDLAIHEDQKKFETFYSKRKTPQFTKKGDKGFFTPKLKQDA